MFGGGDVVECNRCGYSVDGDVWRAKGCPEAVCVAIKFLGMVIGFVQVLVACRFVASSGTSERMIADVYRHKLTGTSPLGPAQVPACQTQAQVMVSDTK